MKIAFCFAGQGAQAVGMGHDFYENLEFVKNIYDKYPEVKKLCFEDLNGAINETKNAQPAMLLTSYLIAKALEEKGIKPEYCCGLSLGEYSALAYSDVWDLKDALEIISNRGEIMQNALPLGTTKMAAIIGLEGEQVRNTVSDIKDCEVANYNCPGQVVITGTNDGVDKGMEACVAAGARRAVPLNVSGAFHSSLLNEASLKLRTVLDKFNNCEPKYKIVYNVSGKEEQRSLNDILQEQICHSVYFEDSIKYMISQGVDTFVEIGPGKTLSSFIKKTNKDVTVYNVSDFEGYKALIEALNA